MASEVVEPTGPKTLDQVLWAPIRAKFKDAVTFKQEHQPNYHVYHVTLFFPTGHTQMIYIPEDAINQAQLEQLDSLNKILDEYVNDSAIYTALQEKFLDGVSFGFRVITEEGEWVARINYADYTHQIVTGTLNKIEDVGDRIPNPKVEGKTSDLVEELVKFVDNPDILRQRMDSKAKYDPKQSFDALFEERTE